MITYWQSGKSVILPERARRVRMLGDVGPVGSIIRASVRTVAQNLAPFLSHKIANQVLKDLAVAGNSTGRVRGEDN